jgi:hypothetical protein
MVTRRLDVDKKYVNWYDGQQVSEAEFDDEQNRNLNIDAANIANFLGSGVLEADIVPNVIFDSSNLDVIQQGLFDANSFDGSNVYVGSTIKEVSDVIQGVNLAVTLVNVDLVGSAYVKVCIIGDSFGDVLIHDDFVFRKNGTKITRNRYKNIRSILFNNFAGNSQGSRSFAVFDGLLTGSCVVREAFSLESSIDTVLVSQEQQPNQYFSNFAPGNPSYTVMQMLQEAVGADKDVGELNVALESVDTREIIPNDITTRVGQKFLATGKNIQKISLILSVKENLSAPPGDEYAWSGSILLELRKLQTDVSCPVSPIPDNALDFDPDPTMIAYLSLTKDDLEKQGIVLDGSKQVVDFVFTSQPISNPSSSVIDVGSYYVFAFGRTGDAHTGTILLEEASNRYENGYMVIFDGSNWINVSDSDMWFVIEGEYIKVSDGIAYEDGVGVQIQKIEKNEYNVEAPFIYGLVPLFTSQYNADNFILLEKTNQYSDAEQDQRTGNYIYSRITPYPEISLTSLFRLNTLRETDPAPVLLGNVHDGNPKGNSETIEGTSGLIGLGFNNVLNILLPDADIRTFNLVGSIITPNTNTSNKYRIIKSELIYDSYGDVNGDGEIDELDVALVDSWLPDGYDIRKIEDTDSLIVIQAKIATQEKIAAGSVSIEEILRADVNGDGIVGSDDADLIGQYVNKEISSFPAGSTFPRMKLTLENLLHPLDTVVVLQTDTDFIYIGPKGFIELNWSVNYFATWFSDNLVIEDLRRLMPTTFTDESTELEPKGQNNFFVPGDLIIGGQMINPDGSPYSVDVEMTQIILDVPILDGSGNKVFLDGYHGIDLFETFVAESSEGKTAYDFNALKYSDGTYVQMEDFADNKIKFSPALQSISSQFDVLFGSKIEDIVGLYYDPSTSLMTLYINNVYDDEYGNLLPPLSTKIIVTVYLKKAGFENTTRTITQAQMRTLFNL